MSQFRLPEKVTPAQVAELAPEVVILASGAAPTIPDISGANRPNVAPAVQVLKDERKVGQNVVIMGARGWWAVRPLSS